MKKHLPNFLTILNLACGTVAIVFTLEGQWRWAIYLILLAVLFDFLDGLVARLLNASSETGKQLDSLADMVTFGVLPALFIYTLFKGMFSGSGATENQGSIAIPPTLQWMLLGSILIVPAFSAIRLARFNLKENETSFFNGLPTPAHALFWTGIFWQFMQEGMLFGTSVNVFFLWAIMMIMVFQMILPVPMYSLKFSNLRLRGNLIRYVLLISSLLILLTVGLSGLSLVVLAYILLSLLNLLLQTRVSK
jgi:CDP-diacylglycerol--serine O-phosphatidyltransferase